MDISEITPEFWISHEEECQELLREHYNSIPLLNANHLQDLKEKRLVKFSGMIQDMFNPEYYLEKYEVINQSSSERKLKNGKYVDILKCEETETIDYASKNNVTSERKTFVVISVPGLNEWVHNYEQEAFGIKKAHMESSCTSNKRPLGTEIEMDDNTANRSHTPIKKPATADPSTNTATPKIISPANLLNFPFPDNRGKACHVKFYQNSDEIKLNNLVEVVGFLSLDSVVIDHVCNYGENDENSMEFQTHNPPCSLVPRIHCVALKKIEHNNCLVNSSSIELEQFLYLKQELHLVLTQLLLGDSLAAEYLIYHLISKVYMLNEMEPIGKFSLNITNIPIHKITKYAEHLYKFIELLVPKSYFFPMTISNMNELAFMPKKDYVCDRITSAVLQLSNNTHFVIDETTLQPGTLYESGVKTAGALSRAIKVQKVAYDFNYYQMEFDCDIPFLILSEAKSLLPNDVQIALKPDNHCVNTFKEIVEAAKQFLNSNLLNNLRVYLTLARFAQYKIDDDKVIDLIQNDFVRLRQEQQETTADDLHQLLVLARLVCLSEGKATLDSDCWRRAYELEIERKKRQP